jgi:phosphatidylcholine synthase
VDSLAEQEELSRAANNTSARFACWCIHLYTALGIGVALFCLAAIVGEDYRLAFLWMALAVVIDSTDGALARRGRVSEILPQIDGRKLDDIADYLNYTFVPIFLMWHADFLPAPKSLWAVVPLIASALAFVHSGAKDDDGGFFRGFPSYWNIAAFYVAVTHKYVGSWSVLAFVLFLSLLSVLPVRFVYPTKAPRWRPFFLGTGVVGFSLMLAAAWHYPDVPVWLLLASLVYPTVYIILSIVLACTEV